MPTPTRPLRAGDPAPDIVLPAVNREGEVALRAFRGKRTVLIGLFRGLHCPFCRRQVAQLGAAQADFEAAGVETIAVLNTPVERARIYYRDRPLPLVLLGDPEARSHRAFGVPAIGFAQPGDTTLEWPTRVSPEQFQAARIDLPGEFDEPVHPVRANEVLNAREGFKLTAADEAIFAVHGMQLTGHFLVDRQGIVRWAQTEGADGPSGVTRMPSVAEMLAAARTVQR
jgi:peroxiredoxin